MIWIQIILIVGFIFLIAKFLSNPLSQQMSAWKKIFGLSLILIAIVTVLFPDLSNRVAHIVGVGRGTDLLIYLLTLAFLLMSINLYIKEKRDQTRLSKVARKLAILEANAIYDNEKS